MNVEGLCSLCGMLKEIQHIKPYPEYNIGDKCFCISLLVEFCCGVAIFVVEKRCAREHEKDGDRREKDGFEKNCLCPGAVVCKRVCIAIAV